MEQAEALFEYWEKNPPTHVILAARYLGDSRSRGSSPAALTEDQAMGQMNEIAGLMDVSSAEPMPPELRQAIAWAEQRKAEMKRTQ